MAKHTVASLSEVVSDLSNRLTALEASVAAIPGKDRGAVRPPGQVRRQIVPNAVVNVTCGKVSCHVKSGPIERTAAFGWFCAEHGEVAAAEA